MELLNRFQSRAMQFSLELFARMERHRDAFWSLADIREISAGYGRFCDWELKEFLDKLVAAGFLMKKDNAYRLHPDLTVPRLPPGQMERDYLQYILTLPEASLFLSEQTRKALEAPGPSPLQHIRLHTPLGAPLPEAQCPEDFRTLLTAIKTRRMVSYTYRTRDCDTEQQARCLPWKLEYSAYDRRWWVIFYDPEARRTIKSILNYVRKVHLRGLSSIPEEEIIRAMDSLLAEEPVELRIRDEHNALQRCFLTFENQRIRETKQLQGTPYYKMVFDYYRFDEVEILRQLMRLGPNVTLIRPDSLRQALLRQVEQALQNNT